MSKEKQIEEMAKILCGMKNGCDGCMWEKVHCNERNYAEEIYNAGYHKQSEPISCGHEKGVEWISVDERMPEDDFPKDTDRRTIRCLVATNKGTVKACVRQRYISPSNGKLTPWCWSKDVYAKPTHWMPLPEPPMMKGGAE